MGRPRPVPGLCANWLGSDQVVLPHRACFCLPKLQWERQYPPDGGGGKGDWSDVGASSLYTVCAVCVPAAHCLFWTWNKCSGESGIQALYPLVIELGGGSQEQSVTSFLTQSAKCYLFSRPVRLPHWGKRAFWWEIRDGGGKKWKICNGIQVPLAVCDRGWTPWHFRASVFSSGKWEAAYFNELLGRPDEVDPCNRRLA